MSWLTDLRTALINKHITTTITIGHMTPTPDDQITLTGYGGMGMDRATDVDYPAVQVRVRAAKGSYATGLALISQIATELQGYSGTVGSTRFLSVYANAMPEDMGRDANDRPEWVCNFMVTKER